MPNFAQTTPNLVEDEAVVLIKQIYTEVSSDGSNPADLEMVRSFFIKNAVIVLRTSREGSTQFTLEEFIQDFKDFYNSPAPGNRGLRRRF